MAANESSLFQLKFIRERTLSEQETNILNAFDYGMQPATVETAAEAARRLDRLFPHLEQVKEANDYLLAVWELMMDMARSPEATGPVHERLVLIVGTLRRCLQGSLSVGGVRLLSPLLLRLGVC